MSQNLDSEGHRFDSWSCTGNDFYRRLSCLAYRDSSGWSFSPSKCPNSVTLRGWSTPWLLAFCLSPESFSPFLWNSWKSWAWGLLGRGLPQLQIHLVCSLFFFLQRWLLCLIRYLFIFYCQEDFGLSELASQRWFRLGIFSPQYDQISSPGFRILLAQPSRLAHKFFAQVF